MFVTLDGLIIFTPDPVNVTSAALLNSKSAFLGLAVIIHSIESPCLASIVFSPLTIVLETEPESCNVIE